CVSSRFLGGDPFLLASCSRDFAIERHRGLHCDEWRAMNNPVVESLIQLCTFISQHAGSHFDSGTLQNFECFATMIWIRVRRADDDVLDASLENGVGARRTAAVSRTRFQGDVEPCSFAAVSAPHGILNGLDFAVWFASAMMPPASDDFSVPYQDSTDHWIGRCCSITAPRQAQGQPHVVAIRAHQTMLQQIVWRRTAANHPLVPRDPQILWATRAPFESRRPCRLCWCRRVS